VFQQIEAQRHSRSPLHDRHRRTLPVGAIDSGPAYTPRIRWTELGRLLVLALNGVVDFLAMDRDVLWRVDSQANFIAADIDNRDHHIVTDHDALIAMSRQD